MESWPESVNIREKVTARELTRLEGIHNYLQSQVDEAEREVGLAHERYRGASSELEAAAAVLYRARNEYDHVLSTLRSFTAYGSEVQSDPVRL